MAILTGARIDRLMAGHACQDERVIKLTAGRQSDVGGDSATVERELRAAVEIEPKRHINRFTRRIRHMPRPKMRSRHWFSSQNQRSITSIAIARCVVFLASDNAGFITGSTISANGGQFFS